MKPLQLFVTGTDTGVGKTEVSCALLRLMRAQGGSPPFAFKPYESGGARPSDSERLRTAAGGWQPLEQICLHRFRAPLAPGIAAKLERRSPSWAGTLRSLAQLRARGPGLVEGAGGLFVPLDARHDVIDLAAACALPVVLVARAGLGTLNHTTLSLQALEQRGLQVAFVVLSRSSAVVDPSIPHNRPELERRFRSIRFVGPVPFERSARRREQAFDRALRQVVKSDGRARVRLKA
jgi:dethiobiotin synthetase